MIYAALNAIIRETALRGASTPLRTHAYATAPANSPWSLMALYAALIRLVRGETKIAARSPRAAMLGLRAC